MELVSVIVPVYNVEKLSCQMIFRVYVGKADQGLGNYSCR